MGDPYVSTRFRLSAAALGFVFTVSGCTTTSEIRRPNGTADYVIGCGAGLGWNVLL